MKLLPLAMMACLLSAGTGCRTPQTSDTIGAAEASLKTKALASITAKYPRIGLSELKFSQINIQKMAGGKEAIFVTYELPASATTATEDGKATTSIKTINVRMSSSGIVDRVYESTNHIIYSVVYHVAK